MYELLYPLTIMLSPRGLEAVGRGAGLGGLMFFVVLLLVLGAAMVSGESMRSNYGTLLHRIGMGMRSAVHIAALLAFGATYLGLAGYAVNETFARWYPNLGVSFTLLLVAVLILVFAPRIAGRVVALLSLGIVAAVAFLSWKGILVSESGLLPAKLPGVFPDEFSPLGMLYAAGFALLGFDLAASGGQSGSKRRWYLPALLIGGAVLASFAWAAMSFISPESLMDTTIPHMIVARKAMGQVGRYIMAAGLVCVGLGALVMLLAASSANICGVLRRKNPTHEGTQKAFSIIQGLTLGVLLAVGLAGEPVLETFISATVAAWFVVYLLFDAAHAVAAFRQGRGVYAAVAAFVLHACIAFAAGWYCEDLPTFLWLFGGMLGVGLLFALAAPKSLLEE